MTVVEYHALRARIMRETCGRRRISGDTASRQSFLRRVSIALAIELRERGALAVEGYAPGSWAAS